MSRYARKREPPIRPVKSVEIDDKNRKWKLIAAAAFLVVGACFIAWGVKSCTTMEPGWQQIQASAKVEETCAGDFVFFYLLGEDGKAVSTEQQEVTKVYTQCTTDAFQIFHETEVFGDVHNVAYLNQHVNEEVEVPRVLYEAFALLEKYENRGLYLAPLYQEYVNLFLCDGDWTAEAYDPDKNPEQDRYFSEILTYTSDEQAVRLELLGNNRVRLSVSEAYLQYAQEKEISVFIDFYWMKNAFIADYLAQQLTAAGYTKGTLSSYDGFSRNLDTTDGDYKLNLFDRVGKDVYLAGAMQYKNVMAAVSLRNYSTSELAVQLYYQWKDGTYTSCHISPVDGRSKSVMNDMTGYSYRLSCGEILMQMYPLYVADTWDEEGFKALPANGVETAYCRDYVIYTSDPAVAVSNLYERDGVKYRWEP
ncbi:MAG: hypothetical protein E7462_05330 [Ruminococcaceae bacterium]|nr:hypothetical protein [Oscillospiraceae bacterium]